MNDQNASGGFLRLPQTREHEVPVVVSDRGDRRRRGAETLVVAAGLERALEILEPPEELGEPTANR